MAEQLGEDILESELRRERMQREIYDAMFAALERALPELREAVSLRQKAFGGGRMKIWNLLSRRILSTSAAGRLKRLTGIWLRPSRPSTRSFLPSSFVQSKAVGLMPARCRESPGAPGATTFLQRASSAS